mgnify:CR=1 FL=1
MTALVITGHGDEHLLTFFSIHWMEAKDFMNSQWFLHVFFSVSKTTKELILKWKEDKPVDISHEVKMPQFEIFKVNPAKCEETFHIGKM